MICLLISCIVLTMILFYVYVWKNIKVSEKDLVNLQILTDNISICRDMLNIIGNNHTKIEYNKDEKSNLSYYNNAKDVIILKANNSESSRFVHIAHECIHTIQNKEFLRANKFFSNLQIIYFLISLICIINSKQNQLLLIAIQLVILLGTLFVKVVIEGDASYRSIDLAETYLMTKITKQELESYIKEIRRIIYNLMPVYYINFFSQGMLMIIINIIVTLIM